MVSDTKMEYICSTCGKSFKRKSNLKQHENRHMSMAPYLCCGKPFFPKSNMDRHMCSRHGCTKLNVCETCTKSFATNADLLRHQRREAGQKKHICTICGYKEEDSSKLRDHMSKHNGVSLHRCTICQKSYRYRSGLSLHQKTKRQ